MNHRTMLSLPALAHDSKRWRLPLCDSTALALANAAVEADLASRAHQLAGLLAVDPAMATWAVFLAASDDGRVKELTCAPSISGVANWLSPRLIDALIWPTGETTLVVSAEDHGHMAALVAESIGPAHEMIRSLVSSEAFAEPAYLAALTAHWKEWLGATGDGTVGTGAELSRWPLEPPTLCSANSTESKAAADGAWRRWLTEIPGAQTLLPALVQQLHRHDELAAAFDHRLQDAKLESLKEFAYGAGHELNNPLANIATRAQTLLKEEPHPERRRRLAAINSQAFRAHEMLADLMLFARPPQLARETIDLVVLINDVLDGLAEVALEQQTTLHRPECREARFAAVDPVQLRVAIRALCMNSLEALGRAGILSVDVRTDIQDPGAAAQIVVSDNGPGISTDIREKIFDPFFSGREAGRGLGFGLSKCWRIIGLHGGRIEVHSQPGQGATFVLVLPIREPISLT